MTAQSVNGVKRNSLRRAIASARESLATELWPLPTLAVVLAVALGIALPLVDRAVDASLPPSVAGFLFAGGVDSARAVLSAISGSLITATSLTFSLTVVALQLASSQASPRVLRTFAKDRAVQDTLAMFVGTFAYALTVLRTVQDATDASDAQVPRIAVTLASLLTFASVITLALFLGHLARQLRVDTVMRQVHSETGHTIDLVASTSTEGPEVLPSGLRPETREVALARGSGFIRSVDRARLLTIAVEHDLVIEEEHPVGHNVVKATPLARWWTRDRLVHLGADDVERRSRDIAGAFGLSYERTASQDIGFGIRQLTDICVRALSPGVNDPTTAVHALGHVSAILGDLAELPGQAVALEDDDGHLRVILRTHRFTDLLRTAMEQPRRYGCSDPDVVERLHQLLSEVGYRARGPDQLEALGRELDLLVASVGQADYLPAERERFSALAERTRTALAGELR
ncbi:putative membrane protein [Leifsonia sp. AK011]|uniref:DUF2254 domain-containing protein n=1 Tax=Leifsonia sp. AK011 TaxID=2723075 RepID=UPI0015CC9D81|nr:DUF2254 domain-containing protein [Leifsonia sp. AK011]NYF09420.1 putative membrane protein [Leifsonia sp. AK011]